MLGAPRRGPFSVRDMERPTKTELLDAASEKLTEAATLLDRAGEEGLAHDAVELAERVNFRLGVN